MVPAYRQRAASDCRPPLRRAFFGFSSRRFEVVELGVEQQRSSWDVSSLFTVSAFARRCLCVAAETCGETSTRCVDDRKHACGQRMTAPNRVRSLTETLHFRSNQLLQIVTWLQTRITR